VVAFLGVSYVDRADVLYLSLGDLYSTLFLDFSSDAAFPTFSKFKVAPRTLPLAIEDASNTLRDTDLIELVYDDHTNADLRSLLLLWVHNNKLINLK
jgi:hypothetical protein